MRFLNLTNTLSTAIVLSLATSPAIAQTLANRISAAPDGIVRLTFASRPGTCGNGRDMIGYRKALFAENFQSMGDWHSDNCVPGPVRVALTKSDGRVTRVRTSVGDSFPRTSERVTDLGMVSPVEASSYFFALVPQLERGSGEKARFLLPAVLANAGDVVPQLTSLARDDARATESRRQAVHWLGILGDARVIPTLVSFVRASAPGATGEDLDEKGGKKGLGQTAMAALASMEDNIGVPALIDLARDDSRAIRRAAVFWLGQTGDPRAFTALHAVIENTREDDEVRAHAVFSLGQGADRDPTQIRYLQNLFPRASHRMKEQIFLTMGQDKVGGSQWLLEKARDRNESVDVRQKALFWAGQNNETPTPDLAGFYRSATERSLKEHAIFVLSQRGDEAAVDELMKIAQSDPDRSMRSKAMFWLGQKDDPRVAKMIGDKLPR